MSNLLKNKNGELTTTQIVVIVILIVSFLILLYFLFFYNPADVSEEELCYNSVVLRSNSGIVGSETIDLDCRTKYVCITKDGSCEKMTAPEEIKVGNKEEVYLALAEEMRKCWSMFGEGRLEYVGKDLLPDNLYCSICSQIAFDNSVFDKDKGIASFSSGEIDRKDFYNYLATKKIEGEEETYSEYLLGFNNVEDLDKLLKDQSSKFGSIKLDKSHYIMMGITSEISTLGYIGIGAAAAGTAAFMFFSAPALPATIGILVKSAVVGGGAIGGGGAGYLLGTTIQGASGNDFLVPTIVEVNSDTFNSLECEEVTTFT